jgi:ubiquinone/menaquinone biosynthesis C-methylase UbiE
MVRQADACALSFEDGTFDCALALLVLHFVPEARKAVGEMRRVVRPGPTLAKKKVEAIAKLMVRVTVVGRASKQWRNARNPAEADQLNQALSEARARNLESPSRISPKDILLKMPI